MLRTATVHRTNEKLTVTHEVFGKLKNTLSDDDFGDWIDHLNEFAQAVLSTQLGSLFKDLSTLEESKYSEPVRAKQTVVYDGTTVIIRMELKGAHKVPFAKRHSLVNDILGDLVEHVTDHLDPTAKSDTDESDIPSFGALLASILLAGATSKGPDPFGTIYGNDDLDGAFASASTDGHVPRWMRPGFPG
jgi:hypothetical protein